MANYVQSWRTFAEVTTIHGIHDLVSARAKLAQILWAIVLVGSMGLLAAQLYQAIKEYRNGATYFQTSVKTMDSYPPIRIIPENALNFTKAQNLGLSEEHFCFLLGFFRDRYSVPVSSMKKDKSDLDQIASKINAIGRAKNMSNVFDLAEFLAFDPEEFLYLHRTTSPDVDLTASKVVDTRGVSYKIGASRNQNKTDYLAYALTFGQWTMTINGQSSNDVIGCSMPSPNMRVRGVRFMIAIGDDLWDAGRWVSIKPGTTVQMTLQASEKHLISKPDSPCQKGRASMMKCILDCRAPIVSFAESLMNETTITCSTDGSICFTKDTGRVGKFYNSWYDQTGGSVRCNKTIISQIKECVKDCKEPCQKRSFIANIKEIYFNTEPEFYRSRVTVNMESGWAMDLVQEAYVYTPSSLIIAVGGLMGLFAGASVISILQFVVYAIFGSWLEKKSAQTTPQDGENSKK